MQVGAPYIATWVFGDPHEAATGIIPEILGLQLPAERDVQEQADENALSTVQIQGQPPMHSSHSAGEGQQTADSGDSCQAGHAADEALHENKHAMSSTAGVVTLQHRSTRAAWCKNLQCRIQRFGVGTLRWLLHVRQHGHVTAGLINLGYEVAYLLKMSPYFSPAHHISGVVLVRDDGSRAVRGLLLRSFSST